MKRSEFNSRVNEYLLIGVLDMRAAGAFGKRRNPLLYWRKDKDNASRVITYADPKSHGNRISKVGVTLGIPAVWLVADKFFRTSKVISGSDILFTPTEFFRFLKMASKGEF